MEIGGIAAGGDGIGHLSDGRVVFGEGALPGERVVLRIVDSRKDFARGVAVEVLEASPLRVDPPCPHLGRGCGGCTWQHVRPADQPELKAMIVRDALRRIAKLPMVPVRPAPAERGRVPAEGYRTSVRLAVSDDGRPAYRRRHSHRLVPVDSCGVSHRLLAELIADARFPGAQSVGLRVSAATGERMASPDRLQGRARVPAGTEVTRAGGTSAITEVVGSRRWRVSPDSFFQSGPAAAELLLASVLALADVDVGPGATIVDLYAGIGLLGGGVMGSTGAQELVSVESNAAATADARVNLADLAATVVGGEVAGFRAAVRPDLVIADPARSGLGRSAAQAVAALGAPTVVLVSCDPASLARDAVLLGELGYGLEAVEVVDLFPATFHTETVSRFTASEQPREGG
ncbi:MAG: class I SAM-dependent RNA methyltransferase [Acidimicrobiales bacterium]